MRRFKFVIIGVGIIASIGYLIFSAIQATGVNYEHVHELVAIETSDSPHPVKTTGKVQQSSLNYDPHEPRIEFRVKGNQGQSVRVVYKGLKPDAMTEGGHVILQGRYDPSKKLLKANTLLAKCPSRYKSEYSEQKSNSSTTDSQ